MLLGFNTLVGAECRFDESFNWMLGSLIVGTVPAFGWVGMVSEIVLPASLCEYLQAILLFPSEDHQYLSSSHNQLLFHAFIDVF